MRMPRINLAAMSRGSGLRAAGILVVAHLVLACLAWGFWFFGLLPIFDRMHWIPATLAVAFLLVSLVLTFGAFGMWGSPRPGGRAYGENRAEGPRSDFNARGQCGASLSFEKKKSKRSCE